MTTHPATHRTVLHWGLLFRVPLSDTKIFKNVLHNMSFVGSASRIPCFVGEREVLTLNVSHNANCWICKATHLIGHGTERRQKPQCGHHSVQSGRTYVIHCIASEKILACADMSAVADRPQAHSRWPSIVPSGVRHCWWVNDWKLVICILNFISYSILALQRWQSFNKNSLVNISSCCLTTARFHKNRKQLPVFSPP